MLRFFKTVGTAILTIAPPVFWTQYLATKRKDTRVNRNLSRTLFMIGILTIVPIVVIELTLSGLNPFVDGTVWHHLLNDFAFVAFVEEFCKWTALALLTAKYKNQHCRYSCVVWAVAVSLGFAMIENVLYVKKCN
jgi:RsiW-degrading membrane proteinase PrsW (M82 family)